MGQGKRIEKECGTAVSAVFFFVLIEIHAVCICHCSEKITGGTPVPHSFGYWARTTSRFQHPRGHAAALLWASLGNDKTSLLSAGEDYELLFTVKASRVNALRQKMNFSAIGRIKRGHGVRYFLNGRSVSAGKSFEHF